MPRELTTKEVRWRCNPTLFRCSSTEELKPAVAIIGQDRALSALQFGLNISKKGFNIYVSGLTGTGRTTAIKSFLDTMAAKKESPSDWCYVYNFKDAYCPRVLKIPPGMGRVLQKDMKTYVESARRSLAQAFASKEYADRKGEITEDFNKRREGVFKALSEKTQSRGLLLQATPGGLIIVPASEGEPMSDEDFRKLSDKDREELRRQRDELTRELKNQIAKLKSEESEVEKRLEETDREVVRYSIGHIFEEMKNKYDKLPQVIEHLDEVEKDVIENYEQFRSEPKVAESDPMGIMQVLFRRQILRKYEINVLVDNSELKGAPVILELNPTFNNLFGRIEKEAQFGALYTDFSMIKSGSLHRANGGYLVVRIEDILKNFESWEGMKRTLRDGKLVIEEISERLGFMATRSLMPEPIPLNIKVVVIGEPLYYYLLLKLDLEFGELFKVKADFDSRMDKTVTSLKEYARVVCRICKEENLLHLESDALARIMEHSVRLAGDQEKLSTLFADIADIVREASFWAEEDKVALIEAKHVEKAIEQRIYRSNLIQQRINEMIDKGMIKIDHEGYETGQVNGLEVIELGNLAFGKPTRITASLGVGREGVIDIEREAKLGGRLHTKGVMILSGFMNDRYARDVPLSLSARLVFEQSYEEVEGDSASSAELYTLLSRLAQVPINQGIAVTGSVNQKGEMQAIGGVNEKVEGFFEVCRAKGLSGQQGVLIPDSNIKNLMLKEEVVTAVNSGDFHLYPVSTIDEGMEILTGVRAGKRLEDGNFEPDSINDKVQRRLHGLAERLRDFVKTGEAVSEAQARRGDTRDQSMP
jgi:lon-related putative ATP-dependent protease